MPVQLVTIGASIGGLEGLRELLANLPRDFPPATAVVQHRGAGDFATLLPWLTAHVQLPLVEVQDKEEIKSGYVYLAPPDYHLLAEDGHFALSADLPVMDSRPSIDILFESAAEAFRDNLIGVLLTGTGLDGLAGLAKIKQFGGYTIVQDGITAEHDSMLPLSEIAPCLARLCMGQGSFV